MKNTRRFFILRQRPSYDLFTRYGDENFHARNLEDPSFTIVN